MAKLMKEKLEEESKLKALRDKFGIKVEIDKELAFKDLMMLKSPQSGFFFEFKKKRTTMLKEREPAIPEPYYKRFKREKQEAKIAEVERKRLADLHAK